jgi:N-acetylmuramoyl-L-alanine amidase
MRSNGYLVGLALVWATLLGSPTFAHDDPSIAAFGALKKDVEALRKDSAKKQFRHHYEKLIVRLQAVANTYQEGQRADDAAFVAAQLLEELSFVSRLAADRASAVEAYVSAADRFPTSNLADDALVAAARLAGDVTAARALLLRVTAIKNADLKDEAKRQLATLQAAARSPAASGLSVDAQAALDLLKDPAARTSKGKAKALSRVEVLPEAPPAGTPARKVVVIRHEKTDLESIVVLRLSGDVGITRGEVPIRDGGARRIYFDLAPARLGQRNLQPIDVQDGTIARVRAGQYDAEVVRLVVELEGDGEPALQVERKPFEVRLVTALAPPSVDVIAGALAVPLRAGPRVSPATVKQELTTASSGGVSVSQQLGLKVHRVVIDAVHGGNDTGAVGLTGLKEKDVTLQIAGRVKEKLLSEFPDVEVIMTRDDDRTLALQARTNTANSAAADLFISIHCNASPHRRVRGVETYTLNITHDRYAMKLAARENAEMGEGSISDLEFILADLAMMSNVDDSVRLGRSVQKGMMKNLKKRWSDVPDLGLKHALFYVLMGNHMPSILIETSFLSNKMDEQRLATAAYQDSVADGVLDGVREFIEERQAFFAP